MEASIFPSEPPAPMIVWISSMNRMMLPDRITSLMTRLILWILLAMFLILIPRKYVERRINRIRAVHGRRPIVLEPMNPYERRIIHSCLQSDRNVITSSEGEEPYRHVVISLKRGGKKSGGKADGAEQAEE